VHANLTTPPACSAGFAALLDANGLTEADVESSCSSITELEMFLQQYPKVGAQPSYAAPV
jgi:hypothetical protein